MDGFGWALLAALVIAAATVVLDVIVGANDSDAYMLRVIRRVARRQGGHERTDVPGIIFLEIDGLGLPSSGGPCATASPRDAPLAGLRHAPLAEWETDLSSQTGASQAGILLGSNDDIPAFRWVEKETGRVMACSPPADCAELERRHAPRRRAADRRRREPREPVLRRRRGVILTVSRMGAEKHSNPGYRAFFANGFNVTRLLVLFAWEFVLERVAAVQQVRRADRPRGQRGDQLRAAAGRPVCRRSAT